MSYIKYNLDITQSMYSEYEKLRKENLGNKLSRKEIEVALFCIGIPEKSPKIWNLLFKYEIFHKEGKAAGTFYMFPKEQIPYSRFEGLENDFYNGLVPKKQKKEEPKEKEIGRIVLNEDYCINYLKQRGYAVFKLTPKLNKMQEVLTPKFLLESCEAELK